MPKLKSETELFNLIKSGKLPPAYFFYGSEGFRIKKAVEALRTEIEKTAVDISTAWVSYDLAETGFGQFISDIKTVSFFGGTRGVIAFNFKPPGQTAEGYCLRDDEQKELLDYLERPSPDVVLILKAGKVDSRLKFWKTLKSKTSEMSFETAQQNRKHIINERLNSSGLKFSPDARYWMEERFTGAFHHLDSEMEKLTTYMAERDRVSVGDLEQCMSAPKIDDIWKLTDAITAGNATRALEAVKSLKKQGEHPIRAIATIASQFRKMLICKSGLARKLPISQITSICGLRNDWITKKYIENARRFKSTISIKTIIYTLSKSDLKVRGSGFNEWMVFEEEILSIFSK